MGLSRLDNFLKSTKGEILYVDPSSLDSTDALENTGNSLARPFKTIQRALIEAARFSYQVGENNDRFGRTTILLYPGEHFVDNRPGWIPIHDQIANTYRLRSGATSDDFPPFDATTVFDLDSDNNALYKLNSVHGGVIIPRGTSIVGLDLRKTKVIPKYVPDPENDQIERSAVFRVTGACYIWQFSIFDGDPNGSVYKDYTTSQYVPNFSHHKLTVFEYADGVNPVSISDDFLTYNDTDTDLEMYYQKIGFAYGSPSGREISPDYPSDSIDIQPKIDEYRIVGSTGAEVGISSIKSGDGVNSGNEITVTLEEALPGLDVNTPIRIEGIADEGYDGQHTVFEVLSPTEIKYQVSVPPLNALPETTSGATLNISIDTVTSASPYIFNISLRSVFGMCGLHADGSKATGFKSMVLAQYTGIGLQKDDRAFVKYNPSTGLYEGDLAAGNENIHTDSRARFRPDWENYHVKCSNNGLLQIVSVFAIGFANHFLLESGADASITNSNSNFGAKALVSRGFRPEAFARDDIGYITHIISPREIESEDGGIEFLGIDVGVTTSVGTATTTKLYLYEQTNQDLPPETVIDGYRFGSRKDEKIKVLLSEGNQISTYESDVVMPGTGSESISEKIHKVSQTNDVNNITSNTMTLEENHTFLNGESVRVISESGGLPDGIKEYKVYYAITKAVSPNPALASNEIKLAATLNDANNDVPITINDAGGVLSIVSRVSDKSAGDIGHPVQYDETAGQWYVNVSTGNYATSIYKQLWTRGVGQLGETTPRTFILRRPSDRNIEGSIYKARYVIPKDSPTLARPPIDGFIIQESNNVSGASDEEVGKYLSFDSQTLSNTTELRNFKFIADAEWNSVTGLATIRTEIPHNLTVGAQVEITDVLSGINTTGKPNLGFNGTFIVDSINNRKEFRVPITINPGDFQNDTSSRTRSLPKLKKKKHEGTYVLYKSEEVSSYVKNEQDGVYHLTLINSSNSPQVAPFQEIDLLQPLGNLYPEYDRDNPTSDPEPARTFAVSDPIGKVVVNDPEKSITKETIISNFVDSGVGFGITDIVSTSASNATTHTLYTDEDHGLNRIIEVSVTDPGANYGTGIGATQNLYNAQLIGFAGSVTGSHATARVQVSAAGSIASVKIIDGGSAYGVGNTLSVVGIATSASGHIPGYVTVTKIYDNSGDSLTISRVTDLYKDYNQEYRIDSVANGNTNQISVISASAVGIASTTGIGAGNAGLAHAILNGSSFSIFAADFTQSLGIATFTLSDNHGIQVNDKVVVGGCTGESTIYNGEHIVERVNSLNQLVLNVGVGTTAVSLGGSPVLHPTTLNSKGGKITLGDESFSSRLSVQYENLTCSLSAAMSAVEANMNITSLSNFDLKIGDYLLIDDEIVRIKQTNSGNPLQVFRGVLGTQSKTHVINSVVKRIAVRPIEFRRHSIIRASGHTFEYLGFGPGNYSTAFPDRQDRRISAAEEVISQSLQEEGGFVVYTGMNSDGDFYISNKRVITTTGEEEVFDSPRPRFRGETREVPENKLGLNVIAASELNVVDSIRVDGGDDKTTISHFDGPLLINNKLTVTSDKGLETRDLYLQGDETISRKYTVGITNPVSSVELVGEGAGNPGDVIFNGNPYNGQNVGWIYTTDNDWYPFGAISTKTDELEFNGTFTGTFSGDGSGLSNVSDIWAADSVGIYTSGFIGIGTTGARSNVAFYVEGSAEYSGTLKVNEIIEKTTLDSSTILGGGSTIANLDLDTSSIYYYTQNATANWAVNLRANAGLALTNFLEVGESLTVAFTSKQGATPYYNHEVYVDDEQITPKYYGSLAINSGNANSLDLYTYVVIRKDTTGVPASDFDILYSQSQYQ